MFEKLFKKERKIVLTEKEYKLLQYILCDISAKGLTCSEILTSSNFNINVDVKLAGRKCEEIARSANLANDILLKIRTR